VFVIIPPVLCSPQPTSFPPHFSRSLFLFPPDFPPQIISCVIITLPLLTVSLPLPHYVCVRFVRVSGGLWQGIDRSHSWVNSAYAPGGSRSVLRRNPNSSCELKQVPNPSSSSSSSSSSSPSRPHSSPPSSYTGSDQLLRVIAYRSSVCLSISLFVSIIQLIMSLYEGLHVLHHSK